MPFSVMQGNQVQFNGMFFDANGNVTVPPTATLSITYTTTSNTSAVAVLNMTSVGGSAFEAVWGSSVAAISMATFSLSSPAGVAPLADPFLRIT